MSANYVDNFSDDLGPAKIIHIYEPGSQLKAIVVIDNLTLGTAIGGCRMAPDVSTREVFRLARAMTLKNSVNGLPHGGGKSGIIADPDSPDKEQLLRAFAKAIKSLVEYVPGPDMGTDETCMAYIHDEIGRAVGLPKVLGGLPLDELGMTGFGLAVAAETACEKIGLSLKNAKAVIQGFGNVGRAAAKFLVERGVIIIGASDSSGAVYNPSGLNAMELIEFKEMGGKFADMDTGVKMTQDDLLSVRSDIFIPAARPDVFTEINQNLLKTRLVLEGANIPITHEAAMIMHARGIMIVPDIIANSGGVICAATEYEGLTENHAYDRIRETISMNTEDLIDRVREDKLPPHETAMKMARERLTAAKPSSAYA